MPNLIFHEINYTSLASGCFNCLNIP